jgi:hypothetical protein
MKGPYILEVVYHADREELAIRTAGAPPTMTHREWLTRQALDAQQAALDRALGEDEHNAG